MPPPQPSAAGSPRPAVAVDRQIASSNATANAFLGGRQLSWMTPGTAATRRPNPHPPAPRPPAPQAPQQLEQQQQHQYQYQQPPQQQQTQPLPVLPSPAPSDEPSPALSNALDSPKPNTTPLLDVHNMGPAHALNPTPLPVTDARFILDPPTIPGVQQAPRPGAVGTTPRLESFVFVFQGAQENRQENHGQNPSFDGNSTPTASRGPLPPLKPPVKRRRIDQPPPRQTTASLLPILEQYVQACGGNRALDSAVEKPRVMLLTEACKSEDAFFLVLHQLFSLWFLNANEAYANIPLHRPVIDNAFKILESVLKKNELLSPAHQQWFSRFPVSDGQFSYAPIGDAALISQIATFLAALINEHHSLLGAAMQRNYPFLVDELLARLSCYSPVLQFILFTACRRHLGVPDGDLGAQLEQAFRDDQARHRDPVTGRHTLAPITQSGDVEQRNANLIGFYKLIVSTATFRGSGQPNLQSPPTPSTTSPHHTPQLGGQNAFPSGQHAHHHPPESAPYSAPNTFIPAYPSSALPPPSQAPMVAVNPYTATHQGETRVGTTQAVPSSPNVQVSQQYGHTGQNLLHQQRVVGSIIPSPQSLTLAQHHLHQQQPTVQGQQQPIGQSHQQPIVQSQQQHIVQGQQQPIGQSQQQPIVQSQQQHIGQSQQQPIGQSQQQPIVQSQQQHIGQNQQQHIGQSQQQHIGQSQQQPIVQSQQQPIVQSQQQPIGQSQQQPIGQSQQQPIAQSQQQPITQGQRRQQLPSQLLKQQQYQRNLQIPPQQLPTHSSAHPATQSPTYATHRGVHPLQNIQTQQMQYNPWIQQFQPVTSPTNFISNGTHPGLTPAPQFGAQQIQRDLQRSRPSRTRDPLVPPKGTLITRPEWPYDPADRKAILMSLHQAHVRSPKRVIKNGAAERFYQAVKSLPVEPTPIAPKKTLYNFRFEVTEEQSAMGARTSKLPGVLLPVVEHFNGALRWRVRCCMPPSSSEPLTQQQWVTLDGNWPSFMHMTLNDRVLEIRRRPHNGKDLPTEVTDFIIPGTNILKIALHEAPGEPSQNRLLAVEMLETLSHSTIVKSIWSQGPIPEQETLNTIKKRLTSSADDEIAFEAPDLSIDLADPFSSTIFKIPARGVACTHMECFDLENWLNTRPAKPPISCPHKRVKCTCPNTAEPSNPDKWRCPICSKDARPYSLRIDGFLLKVRAQLEAEGKLHTKSLRVKADGSWSVVLEADDDGLSDDEGGGGPAAPASAGARKAPQVPALPRRDVEVIELD